MVAAPHLVGCYFDPDRGSRTAWSRMGRVFEATAAAHCGSWQRAIARLQLDPSYRTTTGVVAHVHNTQKLDHWVAALEALPDGAQLLLIDADVMILRPLDAIWDREFDLAYTTRSGHAFPFNLGVMFWRVSPRVRSFVRAWQQWNRRLFDEPGDHLAWRKRFGGVNQAAFGQLLEAGGAAELALLELACDEWNCEESGWERFDPARTRIVHLKSALRRSIFSPHYRTAGPPALRVLADHWRQLERDLDRALAAAGGV